MPVGLGSDKRAKSSFALNTAAPLSDAFPLRSKRCAFERAGALHANCYPFGCQRSGVLRCNMVAPTCPRPRFARRGQASRIFIVNAERRQAASSAACPFNCAGEICKPRSGVKSSTPPSAVPPQGPNPQTCSSSINVPLKSLGCRNSTGLPCAPIFGSPSPSTRAPTASKRSRAAPISSTS